MKVLMTADTIGGVWTYALELADALGQYDVEVALATMGAPLTADQREMVASLANVTVFESDFKLEWMENPWRDVAASGEWLLQLERRTGPDIVHLNGYAHGALRWSAPTLVVGHSCVLSWWMAVKGEAAPATWERYRQKITRGLHAADAVSAPTRAMLAALVQHYGPLRSVRVVPNGRDPDLFTPRAKEDFVLTAGRLWDEAKNITALDGAAARLPWPVYVAGEAKHPHAEHAEEKPRSNLHPLGRLSAKNLASWFARASIYALPARYEPFGLSALEAAMAGCALVLGDIPSLREIWDEAAVFVPPDDTEALGITLEELIRNTACRKTFAALAHSRAHEFTSRRMAQNYLAVYIEVLEAKRRIGRELRETTACAW